MINWLVALRIWGNEWVDKRVTIMCDNRAVVDVFEGNRTRDGLLGSILRHFLMLQAKMNVHDNVKHIMGEDNITADALSRVHMDKCRKCVSDLLHRGFEQHQVLPHHFDIDSNTL